MSDAGIVVNSKQIKEASEKIKEVFYEIRKVVVGQQNMIEKTLMAMLTGGHILLEGPPGLAKTLTLKTFANIISANFKRIQFTPDLLPADLIGTKILNSEQCGFSTFYGPVFSNLILADEINRAPAKVQSALLEAMQEKQVTIGTDTYKLDEPFLVLATQNPIETEGTYNLPEAQLDRFMFKVNVDYPDDKEEVAIVERMMTNKIPEVKKLLNCQEISEYKELVSNVYIDPKIIHYIVDIVTSTRNPEKYNSLEYLKPCIHYGASPRGSLSIANAVKANAFIKGRSYVTPADVKQTAKECLRHRIILTYEGMAQGLTQDAIISDILEKIEAPYIEENNDIQ